MKRYTRDELVAFLRAIDRNLTDEVELLVVGGAAASVGYDAAIQTADIDVLTSRGSDRGLQAAGAAAQRETGLDVSVGGAGVAELPCNYEDRIKEIRLGFRNLVILVPDKYDLAISKTIRGYQHDIDAIQAIHEQHRLSQKVLLDRFESEMVNIATANPRNLRINMLLVSARLYGDVAACDLAKKWDIPGFCEE